MLCFRLVCVTLVDGPDGGRVYCERGWVYSSVIEVEFNQGLLPCDYSSLAEAV